MKKLTLLLAAAMLSSMSFAAEVVYKTALFGSSYNSKGVSAYESEWSATNEKFTVDIVNANNNNNQWAYIKMGSKNKALVGSITTNEAIDKAITKIDLTIDAVTANAINSLTLKTKTADGEWTDAGTFTIAKGTQSVVIATPTENMFYQIVADCKQSANGTIQISKVEYCITIAEVPATAIALDATTWTAEQYKSTQLTATLTPAEATTEVVWTSSDEDVATVVNGNVTAVGVGTATITATAGVGVEATRTVTVTAPTILTCDSAKTLALSVSENNEVVANGKFVVRGYVITLVGTPSSDFSKYGNYSFWMADSKDATEGTFEAYQVAPKDGETIVAVGDYVEVVGDLTKHNTTPETVGKGNATVAKLANPTTAIDNTTLRTPSVKTIENGQLVIIRDGVKYNTMGVKLQ